MRRGTIATTLVLAAAALAPASAPGAVTLGQTQSSNTACAAPSFVDVQTAVGPGVPSYTVPAGGGVITAWQHQARDIDGAQLKLKVLRPAGPLVGPAPFSNVGESVLMLVPEPQLYNFQVRIPVLAGDRIGLATGPNAAASPPACNVGNRGPRGRGLRGARLQLQRHPQPVQHLPAQHRRHPRARRRQGRLRRRDPGPVQGLGRSD